MLKIFNILLINILLNFLNLNKNKKSNFNQEIKSLKNFPSSIREWKNSIYVFNKNALNLLPITSNFSMNLIKSYFTLFNKKIEDKIRTKRLLLRFKKLSSNKIYISSGEFKHTNNKVVIILYLFNRQKHNYLLAIKKWYLKTMLGDKKTKNNRFKFENYFFNSLRSIEIKSISALTNINREKFLLIKALNAIKNKKDVYLFYYVNDFYKKLLNKWQKKLQLYLFYKQLIYINKSKLDYTYLQYLKKYLEKLYNKNIEFNLINLKRFYLNSDILIESILLKIKRNRRRMIKYINIFKNKIKPQRNFLDENISLDKKNISINKYSLEYGVINKLKYRNLTGFRLEARGRLTKRYTASRSVSKVIYKGNLLDIDSSYTGLSSVLLKGNLKSNLQFTKTNSKTRIGSFGIRGWVSGN